MNRIQHLQLMADYNRWMNEKVYQAAAGLCSDELCADRKAFFGSILGTLNHLVVADTIWLKRFARHPADHPSLEPIKHLEDPQALSQLLFTELGALLARRQMLDQVIVEWTAELSEADLDTVLSYSNTAGIKADRNFYGLLTHFFNHQTHHRGQATTLLTQAGVDVGSTDLLALVPNYVA
ncbi:diguanylate cyclase [Pseudomonas syringae]|uniref:Diguanylate cyclase n=1 Tax=Pseudomonas syringae TaxID=317 RepID=A0A1C7Z112_PSESX|nr:DinB family protein [Pseudomonas syringae]OCR21835.1 diguanylate cyclase [Pseudomonas syringae]